jgi:hypothetical protein
MWLNNPRHYGVHRDLGESTSLRPPQPFADEETEDEGTETTEDEEGNEEDEVEIVQKDDYEEDLDEESLLKTIDGYTLDGFVVDDPRSDEEEEEEEDGESSEVCHISPLFMFLTYEASRKKAPNTLIPQTTTMTVLKTKTVCIPNSVSKTRG